MTVVLARRFADSICILSDTMISEADLDRKNGIPGRLKIITLDHLFTVAYAGHANQALDAIRQARTIFFDAGLKPAIEFLREATSAGAADFDFIIAQHDPQAELRRVWNGVVSEPLEQTAIGDTRIRDEVDRRFSTSRGGMRDYHAAFIAAFADKTVHLGTGVGGFPLCLFAKPDGHAYRGHSFGHTWKPIIPTGGTTYEEENDLLTGEWSFHHTVMTVDTPGVALLGVEIPQAKTGFVHCPLEDDDPKPIKLLDDDKIWTQHQKEIHAALREAMNKRLSAANDAGSKKKP